MKTIFPRAHPEPEVWNFPKIERSVNQYNSEAPTSSVDVKDGGEVLRIFVKKILRSPSGREFVTVFQDFPARNFMKKRKTGKPVSPHTSCPD